MVEFGISETHIIEDGPLGERPAAANGDRIRLEATSPADLDPLVIVDGINTIEVIEESETTALIVYHGMAAGYVRVTEPGLREFGEAQLANEAGIPDWYVEADDAGDQQYPWWVPDSYQPERTRPCDRCRRDVSIPECVRPGGADGDAIDEFCTSCWADLADAYSRDWAYAGATDIHRARYLDGVAGETPHDVPIEEVFDLAESSAGDARMHALTAIGRVLPERMDGVIARRSRLADLLKHEDVSTRFGALSALTVLAEHDPEAVLPVTEAVLPLLGPTADGGIIEEGIRFVAAVAEEYPTSVIGAATPLCDLLETDPPFEEELLGALGAIAEVAPATVADYMDTIDAYVADEASAHRVSAIYVLGQIGDGDLAAVSETIPTMIDLLENSDDRVRANASALLADLSTEYPESMTYDIDRIVPLVTDPDDRAQHNAAYILAQVATRYPEEVTPATEALIEALDADMADTRISACKALGRSDAGEAVGRLEELRDDDPEASVRDAAGWALGQLAGNSDGP